ncbi:hypothetical protein H0H92_005474 [Tricholoma furcatifolium]|nr:hypothetical protein H0H92_005474 [Tricholoma furcatifolium]
MLASSVGEPSRPSRQISAWVPVAAFAGTSIVLALPLVYIARQRKTVLRKSLAASNAAPPRRSVAVGAGGVVRKTAAIPETTEFKSSSEHFSSPGMGEMLSAISRVDASMAKFAGKAFAIATGLVVVGAVGLTVGVQMVVGVDNVKDFAQRMRQVVWGSFPGLTSQIHRPLEENEEGIPASKTIEPDPSWKWEEAERRMQAAYDKGGFPEWSDTALREMEEELKVERAKRQNTKQHLESR